MKYTVTPFEGESVVEVLTEDGDGEICITMFSGPATKARAFEYAAWKISQELQ